MRAVGTIALAALLLAAPAAAGTAADAENVAAPPALPLLLDLGADKCVPCKLMAPILEELTEEQHGVLEVKFIDVWKHPDEAKPYRIKLIPTQIFFAADGEELWRHQGFISKEDIAAKWAEFGVELATGTE